MMEIKGVLGSVKIERHPHCPKCGRQGTVGMVIKEEILWDHTDIAKQIIETQMQDAWETLMTDHMASDHKADA